MTTSWEDVLAILVAFRLTSLLVQERGPFDMFGKLRDRIGVRYDEYSQPGGTTEFAKMFSCFWCVSLWVGCILGLALQPTLGGILKGFAFSAGAILLYSLTQYLGRYHVSH